MTLLENETEPKDCLEKYQHRIDKAKLNFQDLYSDKIILRPGKRTRFDATLVEIFDFICNYSHSQINPQDVCKIRINHRPTDK